ncbi:MAG: DUF6156 family protein [Methylicorpusculum sp.]|uniref:DUF6156 family protein n=1 Tax=Methylicorpusculum sp. TaxID=2713644 RepID=UPI00272035A4|nr:DUF6156 family protein [Methylicorpusculum sp.]MDO8845049.1 DUF6156 family protein [Methylicorpusculum sp.]MDO8940027.1 DUF6156 family protein [Methylicorpusculum sp.]MDO9240674.1 DUF6156 family protein [Methylicorpusculum sp.]MDP2179710.1 DUF6156 family protein [Methylicorpusculum sp.]MDP2203155.1 DUF6156 family protein [Methylicorpusculum sp.]
MELEKSDCRYFVSYSGMKLPLKLVNELSDSELDNRNTFFRGYFDAKERLIRCEKVVYGEVELLHCYRYHESGGLQEAKITGLDDEITVLAFDQQGNPVRG